MAADDRLRVTGMNWTVVWIYAALLLFGWLSIYAAVYNDDHASIFDLTQSYGRQAVWMGVSVFLAVVIMLIDEQYIYNLSYPLYGLAIVAMIAVMVFGQEVKGARAWIEIGAFKLQPAEFAKLGTALALARYMNSYSFNIKNPRQVFGALAIIFVPVSIILLQNDTGSALVYAAFLLVFYREGISGRFYLLMLLVVLLFVASFLLEPMTILIITLLICLAAEGMANRNWRAVVVLLAVVSLLATAIYFLAPLTGAKPSFYVASLIACALALPMVLVYAHRKKLRNIYAFVLLFIGAMSFSGSVDFIFNNLFQEHQRDRILVAMGLEKSYNVTQSKIAIGSGGFLGKGYLEGTQTKFNFVPEQSTDFIFCSIGEEWGFVGSAIVVVLFTLLILKLVAMAERQKDVFGRVYCYCVAMIFALHVFINIGMATGIMPVIGIPLPFISYGGSSLLAFTALLFIALKIDAKRNRQLVV